MIFFTADEHYGHKNIIKYCNRPFKSISEMDNILISNHNDTVQNGDRVYHLGDFTLAPKKYAYRYLERLNGEHTMIRGSHDKWMDRGFKEIIEITIEGQRIVLCHYAMRTWAASHYNSWQLYGHSHGTLTPIGKQMDVGVDVCQFRPISFEDISVAMNYRENNFNLISSPPGT